MLPKGWSISSLGKVCKERISNGAFNDPEKTGRGIKLINVVNLYSEPKIRVEDLGRLELSPRELDRYRVIYGDLLFTRSSLKLEGIAHCNVNLDRENDLAFECHVIRARPDQLVVNPLYLRAYCLSWRARKYLMKRAKTTTMTTISQNDLSELPVLLPPLREQKYIADIQMRWDLGIEGTQKLMDKQQNSKIGLMQQLLTGKRRFKEFVRSNEYRETRFGPVPRDWRYITVGAIASEVSARNNNNKPIPVLSCTKHNGLVRSLEYFGKQIYSEDTSPYKVVQCGQFAYATNHIEEGSIGLLTDIDAALVSPMYTVFETNDDVHAAYLYALFKTELYRHIFATNTNASIDRRGSLRWKQFAELPIALPSLEEQRKIATVLAVSDEELTMLRKQLELYKLQKRGLMEKLLTGQVSLNVADRMADVAS